MSTLWVTGCTVTGDFPWREIAGVVRNVRHRQTLSLDYDPELYVPTNSIHKAEPA